MKAIELPRSPLCLVEELGLPLDGYKTIIRETLFLAICLKASVHHLQLFQCLSQSDPS
jgi:hypothetical protein